MTSKKGFVLAVSGERPIFNVEVGGMNNLLFIVSVVSLINCKPPDSIETKLHTSEDLFEPAVALRCDKEGDGWWNAIRRGTPSHKGIDYKCENEEPIRAWGSGVVINKGNNPGGYGNWVATKQTLKGREIRMFYGHLGKIKNDSEFDKDDIIAYCGRSGNVSAGVETHVHLEVGAPGKQVNPVPVLESVGIKVSKGDCDRL